MSEERTPADKLLQKFLDDNNLVFTIRRQSVRYTDDNAVLIEPPTVVVLYKDQFEQGAKVNEE